MEKNDVSHHISQQFNSELDDVRNRVLSMGGLVEQQIGDAIKALNEGDSDLADHVIKTDIEVNTAEVAVDEECCRILARRQPAAGDLRLVVAIIKTITDLERIGDQAERIARMAIRLSKSNQDRMRYVDLISMSSHVQKILHEALDAFARMDPESAVKTVRMDDAVDTEYDSLARQLITYMMEDPRSISRAMDMLWSARALERIGDHACNICEYVIYLVKGKDVRHTSLEKMEKEVLDED